MQRIDLISPRYYLQETDQHTSKWRDKHAELVRILGGYGTLVAATIINEIDIERPPHDVLAVVAEDFIFPRQETNVAPTAVMNVSVADEWGQLKLNYTRPYDDSVVSGLVRVSYSDAVMPIRLTLVDKMPNGSKLSADLLRDLGGFTASFTEIFEPYR